MISNNFKKRHNGPRNNDLDIMLKKIGVSSIDELIDQTLPSSIMMKNSLNIAEGMNEYEYLSHLKELGSKNKIFRSYIGLGYYNTILPAVILRNVLENPGWYTSYTPYQAEISQGRLEALLNYQTMVADLTAMPLANASLLDEGTAAAEAMIMIFNSRKRSAIKEGVNKFFVDINTFPHTVDVLKNRSKSLNIELEIGDWQEYKADKTYFGALLQYPNQLGNIEDYVEFVKNAHENDIKVAVSADLMSLALIVPPGEWDADIVFGSTQRFGIPMGYGGPSAAYFTTRDEYKRNMPGRIIGISIDKDNNPALRMALQTREQHIKREKATSNICTAQALLAIMAGFYAAYHGADGIKEISRHINILSGVLGNEIQQYGYKQLNTNFYDTLYIETPVSTEIIKEKALENGINFRYFDDKHIGISIDETTKLEDINDILNILATSAGKEFSEFVCDPVVCRKIATFETKYNRESKYLQHEIFNTYHSETGMMRYMKKLENRDIALNRSMIPLGSCTMKLNAAAELLHLSWPEFGSIHPFVPKNQAMGYLEMFKELEKDLCTITGFDAISFQPNSGAAGEYTGLNVIKAYLEDHGQAQRNICLIPASAHGTNPASSVMAGLKVLVVKCDDKGNVDLVDLKEKAELHKDDLAALMITYPSTHGVFEQEILQIMDIIHQNGGLVYMDGANMNAQVGLTNPGLIGADACHLNLHKTFAIPHGGGGPGVGPIGVTKELSAYLPGHIFKENNKKAVNAVASSYYSSALIYPISYGYIKMLGGEGLTEATKYAILNANYIKSCLEGKFEILYTGEKGRVAHEMILNCNVFPKEFHIECTDIAKRLMDYGFHAPTLAFPVHGTLMVEPTESEPLSELDRFIEAMMSIREEIEEIISKKADPVNNPLKNSPHTIEQLTVENWDKPYSREKAAFPVKSMDKKDKYWPSTARINDAYGDRNLICTCKPIKNYME